MGVFTDAAMRRRGLARLAMKALIASARDKLRLGSLVLFCEPDGAGYSLYTSLGFVRHGTYCLL